MTRIKRHAAWDERVITALGSRYGGWPRALGFYNELWTAHLCAGLVDEELVSAMTGADEFARRQRIWEMQLAAHLRACGIFPSRRSEGHPDYQIQVNGVVVWVEAISPAPGDHTPVGWLDEPSSGRVTTPPLDWVLSRWTSALKGKQRKGADYERMGVIKPGEAYVVAIDGGQLSPAYRMSHGASRLPFGVEATFPIGPLAFKFDQDGQVQGLENILRLAIQNHNGANIRTERFLNDEFSNVSAVLGCWPPMFEGPELTVHVVHNPLARVPLALGTFGGKAEEWHAIRVEDGGEPYWQLERLK